MNTKPDSPSPPVASRSRDRRKAVIAATLSPRRWIVVAASTVLVATAWAVFSSPGHTILRAVSGNPGATFVKIMPPFMDSLEKHPQVRLRDPVDQTGGSLDNLGRLLEGTVDVAIVFNSEDSYVPVGSNYKKKDQLRSICPLYTAKLHVVAPSCLVGDNDTLLDLIDGLDHNEKLTVLAGPRNSGTARLANVLLAEWRDRVSLEYQPFATVYGALRSAEASSIGSVRREKFVALFMYGTQVPEVRDCLAVRRTPLGKRSSRKPPEDFKPPLAMRLISLCTREEAHGLAQMSPRYLAVDEIPAQTYPGQTKRVVTISTPAVLVTRSDADSYAIQHLTQALFDHRVDLEASAPFLDLREDFDRDALQFPLHEGAQAYYRRDQPGFWQQNAELIALGVTMFAWLLVVLDAMRRSVRKRRKQRIDHFMADLEVILVRLEELEPDTNEAEVTALRDRLRDLRHEAFRELVAGKLVPDSSFLVVMNYLTYVHDQASRKVKKDRLDEYFVQIEDLREKLATDGAGTDAAAAIREMRKKAMGQLVREELDADPAFQIFLQQLESLRPAGGT